MTLLAPDIVRAILEGRQPRHLNLHAVRGREKEVPLTWDEQRRLFGFRALEDTNTGILAAGGDGDARVAAVNKRPCRERATDMDGACRRER